MFLKFFDWIFDRAESESGRRAVCREYCERPVKQIPRCTEGEKPPAAAAAREERAVSPVRGGVAPCGGRDRLPVCGGGENRVAESFAPRRSESAAQRFADRRTSAHAAGQAPAPRDRAEGRVLPAVRAEGAFSETERARAIREFRRFFADFEGFNVKERSV